MVYYVHQYQGAWHNFAMPSQVLGRHNLKIVGEGRQSWFQVEFYKSNIMLLF